MTSNPTPRSKHEIEHGKFLAAGDTEELWGWGSPAGRVRAQRRAELIAAAAGLSPQKYALEIGCGTGNFTARFARWGARVLAVDISPDLLEVARGRQLPAEQVTFVCRRFEEAGIDGPFDCVIGSSILHHLEIGPALKSIFDLLKPGGRMAFAEPNMLNPQIFAERTFMRRYSKHISPDETAFVRWPLARRLREVGFEAIRIKPFDWLHPAIPSPLIPLVSAAGRVIEWVPGLREFSGSLLIQCDKPM